MTAFKSGQNWKALTKQGFSLVEIIIAAAIMIILIAGTAQFFPLAMKTANFLHSQQSESDFRHFLSQIMTASACGKTFTGKKIGDSITRIVDDVGSPPAETVLFDVGGSGTAFQRNFKVVKMTVTETEGAATAGQALWRIYFHREKSLMGTIKDRPCTVTDTSGCYEHHCKLRLDPANTGTTGTTVGACSLLNCADNGGGNDCIRRSGGCLPGTATSPPRDSHPGGAYSWTDTDLIDGNGCSIYRCTMTGGPPP